MSQEDKTDNNLATPGPQRPALEEAKRHAAQLRHQIVLVTGAYSGIGRTTVQALLAVGAQKVILAGRNTDLQQQFATELAQEFGADRVDGSHTLDLNDLQSVREFGLYVKSQYKTLDCLILNAGVMCVPPGVTKQGFETQFGVNDLGHFLLSKLLVDITKRQVWLTSSAHRLRGAKRIDIEFLKAFSLENTKGYDPWQQYQQSKLGNILLAKEFEKRYDHLHAVAAHPGVISDTGLSRHLGFWEIIGFLRSVIPRLLFRDANASAELTRKSVEAGASTTMTAAGLADAELVPGGYYVNCDIMEPAEAALNKEDAEAFFDFCDEQCKAFQ